MYNSFRNLCIVFYIRLKPNHFLRFNHSVRIERLFTFVVDAFRKIDVVTDFLGDVLVLASNAWSLDHFRCAWGQRFGREGQAKFDVGRPPGTRA